MEIGEVARGTGRTVDRLHVGHELNEIARHEPGSEPEVPAELNQQPRRIAARAGPQVQRLFDRLHTGIEPHDVADVGLQLSIQIHQRVDGSPRPAVDALQVVREPRRQRVGEQERLQFPALHIVVGERELFGGRFEKEIEGVVHRHFDDEIDLDAQFAHPFGKREPRHVVALGVLLPVDEVSGRRDPLRVGQDARAAVRCRSKAHELRRQFDLAVVLVVGHVTKGDMNAQGKTSGEDPSIIPQVA